MIWIPPIVTGVHLILFAVLTYLGHRQRKKFMAFLRDDREAWTAAAERLVDALQGKG